MTPLVFLLMMIKKSGYSVALAVVLCVFCCTSFVLDSELLSDASSQKTEIENGIRIVHNKKGGEWGSDHKISIELVRTIGDINTDDENLAFDSPADLEVDDAGNIYIADSRNQRIQVFNPGGRFVRTIGRKGQGPGEFMATKSIDFDSEGRLLVLDNRQRRIQVFTSRGEVIRTIPVSSLKIDQMRLLRSGKIAMKSFEGGPKLVKLLDPDFALQREFGEPFDYGDEITNSAGNSWEFAVDSKDNIYLCFLLQNRIEKYSPAGQLLWRADRELNYPVKVVEKARREVTATGTRTYYPKFNQVARGLDTDESDRIWVLTCNRQIKKEEEVIIMVDGHANGSETRKVIGDTDLRTTDMYKLEIFSSDGVLLGEIPLTHFVDKIWIHKDRLFLLDSDRSVSFYEYKIVEK